MCGNGPWGFIIGGLILAAAMLMAGHPRGSVAAAPAQQHTIAGAAAHLAIEMRPLSLDIDFAHARVLLEVSL